MDITLTFDKAGFDQTITRLLAGVPDGSPVDGTIAQLLKNSVGRNAAKSVRQRAVQVKSHNRNHHLKVPQREFMLVQEEDWQDIAEIITKRLQKLIRGT